MGHYHFLSHHFHQFTIHSNLISWLSIAEILSTLLNKLKNINYSHNLNCWCDFLKYLKEGEKSEREREVPGWGRQEEIDKEREREEVMLYCTASCCIVCSKLALALLVVPVQLHPCIKIHTSKTFVSLHRGQQFPPQLVHLMMASWGETWSVRMWILIHDEV
jgi:hypothetical protein